MSIESRRRCTACCRSRTRSRRPALGHHLPEQQRIADASKCSVSACGLPVTTSPVEVGSKQINDRSKNPKSCCETKFASSRYSSSRATNPERNAERTLLDRRCKENDGFRPSHNAARTETQSYLTEPCHAPSLRRHRLSFAYNQPSTAKA